MFALDYHEATKHDFNRLARSAGYLDWATQPDPFRRFEGAPLVPFPHAPLRPDEPYDSLFHNAAVPLPVDLHAVGELLRCAMGLSAWKQYGRSRWALRVNPSSGNLHPTEAYVVWNDRVCHYAPREHALEERCVLADRASGGTLDAVGATSFFVALTSIFWREVWKYGERAFRYCQHDAGHAIAALRFSAARLGWRLELVPECSDDDLAALVGLDRDHDFEGAEREAPVCLALVSASLERPVADLPALVDRARRGAWCGRANRLSPAHRYWPIIGAIAEATVYEGRPRRESPAAPTDATRSRATDARPRGLAARAILLQRRSALGFDGRSSLPRDTFLAMLRRLLPGAAPWDAIDWRPHVHLALFVHRIDGLVSGIYAYVRDPEAIGPLTAAMRADFLWEPVEGAGTLFLLVPLDVTWAATRVSCDQDIAGDGFFSLGMIARFEPALREHGESFYRHLFWECGLIGQVLYLEAEAAGARSTGIGCFYDDPVHEMLGLRGREWQSLYHFSMGAPVEDERLTTRPGYEWEEVLGFSGSQVLGFSGSRVLTARAT